MTKPPKLEVYELMEGSIYRHLLKNRNFAPIWIGQAFSSVGDGLHMVALPWLVLEMTGSTASIGVVMAGYMVAIPVFGLAGGVVADRWHRKRTMLLSLAASAGFVLLIPVLFNLAVLTIGLLAAISFLLSTSTQFFEPALNAAVPRMVRENDLSAANSMIMSTQQLGTVLGPALAGSLIALIDTVTIFYIDALTFATATLATLIANVPEAEGSSHRDDSADTGKPSLYRALLTDIGAAFSFVRKEAILMTVILLAVFANFAIAPIRVITPSFVQNVLGEGAESFGFLISTFAVGMVVAMLLVGMLERRIQKGTLILSGFFISGLALGGASLVTHYGQLLPLFFVVGCGFGIINVPFRTLVQTFTPDDLLGKVLSLDMVLSTSAVPLSQVFFGVLAEYIELRWIFVFAGGVLLACALAGSRHTKLRKTH